jgi:cytochrome c biogenesis protein ResB
VIEGGRDVRTATIEVNHPLEHGGTALYQSDFDPEDLELTGLSVVRDPGLWVVYAGFMLCTLGIIAVFYLHPALIRRSREEVV